MGLDLIVEGCPKLGHEDEWRRLLKRSFADEELSKMEAASRKFAFRATNVSAHHGLVTTTLQTSGYWKHETRKHPKMWPRC
jgi:hypothetical protein